MKCLRRIIPLFAALLLAGCSPTVVPVKGTATRDGKPLAHLTLVFAPVEQGHASTAVTDEQGHFELRFDRKKTGVLAVAHKVTARFRPRNPKEEAEFAEGTLKLHPDQDAIHEKFGSYQSTALTVEITKAEDNLQLKLD